jgi:integrase
VRVKQAGTIIHHESRTFDTEPLARDWGKRLEQEIKRVGVAAWRRSGSTLGDLIDQFRVARAEVKPLGKSIQSDLDILQRSLGDKRLDVLSAQVVTAFARNRRAEGAGPATVLHNLATLRTVMAAAEPMFGIPINAEAVTTALRSLSLSGHVAKSAQRDRRPTQAELDALCAEFDRIAAYPQTFIPMATIVRLAVEFPRRISELCRMTWADFDGSVMTLRDTKNPRITRNERVPVPVPAQRIIGGLPRADARILPYNSESVSAAFDRACQRLRIEDLHLHDLRHEGICRLFEAGLNIPEVSLISGHMSWTTLKRYTHLTPQHVLDRLDARSQGEPKTHPEPA